MTEEEPFAGRVALVTGSSRGIGAAIAVALARAGAEVAISYREREDAAQDVARRVSETGRKALPVAADVSRRQSVDDLFSAVAETLGTVDILVNNAGIGRRRSVDELDEDEWDATIATNLKSAFLCSQAAIPAMRARGWGRIVNITSGAARGPGGIGVHYNASKAGLEGLTRGYAAALARDGITVNAVAPSLIETEMIPGGVTEAAKRIPLGRVGRPEEVALAVTMVAQNPYMTGQTLQVNGGLLFV